MSNQDLLDERKKCTFNIDTLNIIVHENDIKAIELNKLIRKEFENDSILSTPEVHYFLSREEQFKRSIIICSKIIQIKKKFGLLQSAPLDLYRNLCHDYPLMLHDIVFSGALKSLASDEQLQYWLPLAQNYRMFGCYAQTEIAHGSNVQGIETIAHYISSTDEFEIHSPSQSATKWWIGGLGKMATHAIVFAQLYLEGKCYGPHPFMVPIRSLSDHKPLPGIIVGDIGPKYGFNCVDNGFLQLNKIRVPRNFMLQRFAKVTESGKYVRPTHPRLIYAGMVGVRVAIIQDSFYGLSRATTIATRYSVVRRQFILPGENSKNAKESQVLDYQNQMNRILPYIAKSFAYLFTGFRFEKSFKQVLHDIKVNDKVDALSELHANSSGLKSVMTYGTYEGIESCRLACGGHGYSLVSGIPTLLSNYVHVVTAEGENNLLPQQTTRFLLKAFSKIVETEGQVSDLGESIKYLQEEFINDSNQISDIYKFSKTDENGKIDLENPANLLQLFRHRSYFQLKNLSNIIQDLLQIEGNTILSIWGDLNLECIRVSKAHCHFYIIDSFYQHIQSVVNVTNPNEKEIHRVLWQLFNLYSLFLIDQNLMEFTQDGYFKNKDINYLRQEIHKLFKLLRPNAIGLVDSLGISDTALGSAIGQYNGNVYETLLKWAKNQPFNQNPVVDGYNEFLKPILKSYL
ncbi:acyl-CoA oxidase [Tieghemostelium lacteum]|uniref:Acyl-coenzyme A oxidase n=1 Tax=Tieghemostelium lacteum TaxID=361077 RepID=A0A152AAD5_TIELA|nr:acyl-CoA oxidase [Tieghemostelium lacteum]|eukprot:KYR03091.1 acyl-CoA oxidase [Tieghemostelium lacteum]